MKNKKPKNNTPLVVGGTGLFVIILAVFFWLQLANYEKGILDVYATQQDAYVQLVLDQINLKENRNDEEIINDILASLDASTNKYWTFSKAQSLLFVKDVLETNKYKELTTESYYTSDSSRDFLESLILNKVTHADVVVADKDYVASGVEFEYSGNNYRLMLLTNKAVLLDNNIFLGSKVLLCTVSGLILITAFLLCTVAAVKINRLREKNFEELAELDRMNTTVSELNEALREKRSRDTKQKLWSEDMFAPVLNRISARRILPASVALVKCSSADAKHDFLAGAGITLDTSVMRFEHNENDLLLLGIEIEARVLNESIRPLMVPGCELAKSLDLERITDLNPGSILKKLTN